MSSLISELEQISAGALGTGVGFGLGLTAAPALTPLSTALRQTAWDADPNLAPDVYLLAVGVAQGQIDLGTAQGWAHSQGISDTAFAALVAAANTGPTLGLAYQAWRRDKLTDAQFATALKRTGLEAEWFTALEDLKHSKLDLGAIATAVHRGIMDDHGLLVTPVPSGTGNVPRIPVSSLDTLAEFAAQGIDPERARVLVADTGLPLSLGEMLQLYNRNQVTATDVKVSIAESNVRNEYMDVALALARRLLTPHEYAEAELRGVMSPADAKNGASLSGINGNDYDTLFAILGRPLNVHEITTGEARGGNYGGDYTDVPAGPYRDAIRRSAIRPEYADLAYANRYTYPSAFVLRTLAQAGDLGNTAAVQQVLEEIGWAPHFAAQVAAAWTTPSGGSTGASKAQTRLYTTAHNSYMAHEISDATATAALETAGLSAAEAAAELTVWQHERSLIRKGLSATQIKKLWFEQVVDPALGRAITEAEAVARLMELGYDQDDAQVYLLL